MIAFARGALLATVFLSLSGCSSPPSTDRPGETGDRSPDQVIEGFAMIITDQGVKKSRFRARRAMIFQDEGMVESEDVHVEFFRSNGEHYSTITADRGVLYTKTKDMDAYRNVVVVSHDNIRLETESLHWDEDQDLITTDDPVTLIQGGKRIQGIGLVSDLSLTDVKIREPMGVFRDDDVPGEG
ncbi:MAG: LPS export ABC transporter periplasmic protein LptC [Candidatus Glassbacteria bacterium RBG_16_58_8]|uniref:LPS export ABC transporter periplasmic protein LptC n=1 Tax=Candidatus Glassbacteria bacterium RBG_16_58_8 TaxID=1817866 RepID=A0A1F5YBR0_9BACT|nr:MAG: LPS export ABC transporter periplasmic protein LptC [Candidatus Glassbacteria bacterium RBG_16_58_8]